MKRLGLFMTVIMILCITVNAQKQSNRTLVAYFSATGTTEKAAKQIAEVTGGALYEIQPAKKYTSADLDWHDKSSRSSVEMADALSRPALRSQPKNLATYDTIYIGFPIWWNLAPRIINSFIEKGDFTGKILIPFATSGGSRISNAEQELKKAYPSLNWQKGRLMNGATKEEIKQWTKK
ncbi:MAG: flavodoxin [Phocaeicola vulgatus]|jgi:flavodoxin|nr:flavodoxin [Phocaeicola vulgatus]